VVARRSTDKRDVRDAEQIGKAIKELQKTGMSACQAADHIDNVTVVKPAKSNGKP
jgi:hypothetical protein